MAETTTPKRGPGRPKGLGKVPGSGRRKGTPNKVTRQIKVAFQQHGDALVKALLKLTKSKDERVRLGAIQAAFDRGWGKAVQAMEIDMPVPITRIERHIVVPNTGAAEGVKADLKAAEAAGNGADASE